MARDNIFRKRQHLIEMMEQEEFDRLLVDVDNLIDRGRWPRHLHWTV